MRILFLLLVFGFAMAPTRSLVASEEPDCALDFKVQTIDGKTVDLEEYEGSVVLVVNVASQCGLTPQYKGLQALYEKYKDRGLVILGFPCNQFGAQEPGEDSAIKEFCSSKFGVTFPMFSKIDVNGAKASPLYQHLTAQSTQPAGKGKISWNFEKFLIGRDGKVANRFAPRTSPQSDQVVSALESALKP